MKKFFSISFLFDRPLKRHKGSNTHFGWKIAKRSALPSEVTRQRRHGRRLTLTCLTIKNGILCSNQAQIRGKIRFQQNVYKLRLMPQPLMLVKIIDRVLYRTDGVTQISIVSPTISGVDSGWFSGDELLFLHNNFVVPSQKNLFMSAMSFANYQRIRLAWVHKPTANRGGHPEILSSCIEIWIENRSSPAPDRRKTQGKLMIYGSD